MAKKLGKRAKSLIALGAAVVLLAGAYLLVTLPGGEEEESPATEEESIILYECDKENITEFTLDRAEGSWSVEVEWQKPADEEEDAEAVFTLKGYPDTPVNDTTINGVLANVSSLKAVGVVESQTPSDLAPYGLDPAVVTATVKFTDGSSEVFYLGNETPAGNSYYMMKRADPAVYEVKLLYGNRFSYTLKDLVKTSVVPTIDTATLERLVLKREGQPDIEAVTYETSDDQARIGVSGFKIISPFTRPKDIDTEAFGAFLKDIAAIQMDDIVSLGTEKDQYGLSEPRMELLLKDSENTLRLYFGDDYGDDQVACIVEGYTPIYAVNKDKIAFLEDADPMALADSFVLLPLIDDVDKIEVTVEGKAHTMTIERRTEKAEEEGKEDKVVETFFLDGEQKDVDVFRKTYQALIGVTADTYTDDLALAEGETVVSITYYFNKPGTSPITVSYHAYDADFYAGAVDGDTQALVAKRKIEKMTSALETLAESEYTEEKE
jgi:hypothetical protein